MIFNWCFKKVLPSVTALSGIYNFDKKNFIRFFFVTFNNIVNY